MNHCWAADRSLLRTACLILAADPTSQEWRKAIWRKAGALSVLPMPDFSTSWEEVLWTGVSTWLILDLVFQGERAEGGLPWSSDWKRTPGLFLVFSFGGEGSSRSQTTATKYVSSNPTPEAASQGRRGRAEPWRQAPFQHRATTLGNRVSHKTPLWPRTPQQRASSLGRPKPRSQAWA